LSTRKLQKFTVAFASVASVVGTALITTSQLRTSQPLLLPWMGILIQSKPHITSDLKVALNVLLT